MPHDNIAAWIMSAFFTVGLVIIVFFFCAKVYENIFPSPTSTEWICRKLTIIKSGQSYMEMEMATSSPFRFPAQTIGFQTPDSLGYSDCNKIK